MHKGTAHPLSHTDLSRRAKRGWETKRRQNPHLAHIQKVGNDTYHWQRPNGEVVPIYGLNDEQVAKISPALQATDKHLKPTQKLNAEIRGTNMYRTPLVRNQAGAYVTHSGNFKPEEKPWVVKKLAETRYGVPQENWGNRNTLHVNRKFMDADNPQFMPAGIVAHEIGHLVGPGRFAGTGANPNKAQEFGKSFQWQAPKRAASADMEYQWNKTSRHPTVEDTLPSDGLLHKTTTRANYQGASLHEDFAESYRNMIGVPIADGTHNKTHPYYWEDQNRSRQKYMLKYHLDSTAR